jgi:hypothetical protein
MSPPPKKYTKVNGVMKLNPQYKRWQDAQKGGPPSDPQNMQLPVISSMEDHMQLNEDLQLDIPLSESTNATIELMQEPEISFQAGMQPDVMVDELGKILAKYEVPIGLMNKASKDRAGNDYQYQPIHRTMDSIDSAWRCAAKNHLSLTSLLVSFMSTCTRTYHPIHYSS